MHLKLLIMKIVLLLNARQRSSLLRGVRSHLTPRKFSSGGGRIDRGMISWDNKESSANVIAMNKRGDVIWHTLDNLNSAHR